MFYHYEGDSGPTFETFQITGIDESMIECGSPRQVGWYWWPCQIGCLPEGDAVGPFKTEDEAIFSARSPW